MRRLERAETAAGFTLLEVLTALVVLGFLMLGLSQGLRLGAQVYGRQSQMLATESELDATDRALRRLIEQMDPGGRGMPEIEGSTRTLRFSSELPSVAALPTRQVQALLWVDTSHRLVLRWSPTRHVQLLAPAPAPVDTILLDGVDHIELAYQLPASRGDGWVTTWKSITPPRLVRIHIAFLKGNVRRWPDILAAPMRDRVS